MRSTYNIVQVYLRRLTCSFGRRGRRTIVDKGPVRNVTSYECGHCVRRENSCLSPFTGCVWNLHLFPITELSRFQNPGTSYQIFHSHNPLHRRTRSFRGVGPSSSFYRSSSGLVLGDFRSRVQPGRPAPDS